MYIFVNAMDYGKVLTIPCQPYDTVSSVKTKIELAMGGPGSVPEDIIDSLNYLGTTLSCVNTLASYGIKDSAYLNMGKALIKKPDPKAPQTQPQPQAQQPQYGYPIPQYGQQFPQQYGQQFPQQYGQQLPQQYGQQFSQQYQQQPFHYGGYQQQFF